MSETQTYYDLAEQAARQGEISFLSHCVDEILRRCHAERTRPEYSRLFKALYEARLYFLHQHTDRAPEASLEDIPSDLLQRLRDLDRLSDLVTAVAEGQPIDDAVRKIENLTFHPIRPK